MNEMRCTQNLSAASSFLRRNLVRISCLLEPIYVCAIAESDVKRSIAAAASSSEKSPSSSSRLTARRRISGLPTGMEPATCNIAAASSWPVSALRRRLRRVPFCGDEDAARFCLLLMLGAGGDDAVRSSTQGEEPEDCYSVRTH